MPKLLSPAAVAAYGRDGVYSPVRVMSADDARRYRDALEAHEAKAGQPLQGNLRHKTHLLFTWADELVHHPKVLDAIEDVIGPDILCWSTTFFTKEAHSPSFVSWHQDATYWGLSSPEVVTAWVAFTPSTVQSGCMRVVPGTQHRQIAHRDTFAETNLLSRGQEIAVDVDAGAAVEVILAPGEMSLHHVLICHGSEPNRANHRRVGFAIRYIAARVHQTSGTRESATLVRGVDAFKHFDHELPPEGDLHPDAVARHAVIIERQLKVLYAGAAKPGKLGAGIAVSQAPR